MVNRKISYIPHIIIHQNLIFVGLRVTRAIFKIKIMFFVSSTNGYIRDSFTRFLSFFFLSWPIFGNNANDEITTRLYRVTSQFKFKHVIPWLF